MPSCVASVYQWPVDGEVSLGAEEEYLEPYKSIAFGGMPGISDIDEIMETIGRKEGEWEVVVVFDVFDIDNTLGQAQKIYLIDKCGAW